MSSKVKLAYDAAPGYCIKYASDTDGAKVVLNSANGFNEKWTMTQKGQGNVTFQTPSGLYLTYMGNQQQLQVRSGTQQPGIITWVLKAADSDSYVIQTLQGNGDVIDDQNQNTNPNNPIWGYVYNSTAAQKWTIDEDDFRKA